MTITRTKPMRQHRKKRMKQGRSTGAPTKAQQARHDAIRKAKSGSTYQNVD